MHARGFVKAWSDVFFFVGYVLVFVDVAFEQDDVELGVFHAADEHGYESVDVRFEHLVADGLVGEHQPELAGFQGDRFVVVLGSEEHVLDKWKY